MDDVINRRNCEKLDVLLERMEQSIRAKDLNQWIALFQMEDSLVLEAQSNWFSGYIIRGNPVHVRLSREAETLSTKGGGLKITITLAYQEFDAVTETYLYTIDDSSDEAKIVWFERLFDNALPSSDDFAATGFFLDGSYPWEFHEDDREGLCEPLLPGIYARLVSRSIRFRESNPLIECAALYANMLSVRTVWIAKQVFHRDKLVFLRQLYHFSQSRIFIQLSRDDRDNTWTSKFTAPSFGIDELIYMNKDGGIILGNCSSIISVYYGILRARFTPEELFQVRFHNQDMLFIKADDEMYVLSDTLVKVTKRTLFYNNQVTKIFNERFILSNGTLHNTSLEKFHLLLTDLKERVPQIEWPQLPKGVISGKEEEADPAAFPPPDLPAVQAQKQLFAAVLKRSRKEPDSIYTLAKYAYQTIYVDKFEAYLKWSEQSSLTVAFVARYPSLEQLGEKMNTFGHQSIFLEPHRIMTADQVIRHQTGDFKGRALLYYAWLKSKWGQPPGIILTDANGYCVVNKGAALEYFDVTAQCFLQGRSKIKGVPVIEYE